MKQKKYLILMLLLIIMLCSITSYSLPVMAQSNLEIEIWSEGKIEILPDTAEINFSIQYIDKIEENSYNFTMETYNKILDILSSNNFDESNIKIQYIQTYSLNSNYDIGFKTCLNFSVKTDINNIYDIINLCEHEYIEVQNINYSNSYNDRYYIDAVKLAIENAKEKVQQIYPNQNFIIENIKEENYYYPAVMYKEYVQQHIEQDMQTPIEIIALVRVTFKII